MTAPIAFPAEELGVTPAGGRDQERRKPRGRQVDQVVEPRRAQPKRVPLGAVADHAVGVLIAL